MSVIVRLKTTHPPNTPLPREKQLLGPHLPAHPFGIIFFFVPPRCAAAGGLAGRGLDDQPASLVVHPILGFADPAPRSMIAIPRWSVLK